MDSVFRAQFPRRSLAGLALGAASVALGCCDDGEVATGQAERQALTSHPALSRPLTGNAAGLLSLPAHPADARRGHPLRGRQSVLVHNAGCGIPISKGRRDHIWERHVIEKAFSARASGM
jgi:hypothetical protein